MKILIADDHTLFRDGLKRILTEKYKDVLIKEASNEKELFELLKEDKWQLVILDLNMPGRGGLEILKDIKIFYKELPVLILSMYSEEQFALRVIKAGASGYLTKGVSPSELIEAINFILDGNIYFSKEVSKLIAKDFQGNKNNTLDKLSDREFEVFIKIASGESLTSIANELSLSVKTISTYRSHILEKLNIKSNADITRIAIENNLIS
ncbi:MAG: response regulator transcription factor [Melioribacteraceae bacterium]|nr:response regulator transcription factor [Melioribacteraceae bacterium]